MEEDSDQSKDGGGVWEEEDEEGRPEEDREADGLDSYKDFGDGDQFV